MKIRNYGVDKCVQATDHDHHGHVTLETCSSNKTNPIHQQHFTLRHFRDIMIHGKSSCLEGSIDHVTFERCHYEQGNQYFRYDIKSLQIFWGRARNKLCLDVNLETEDVIVKDCDESKKTQQWVFGFSRVSMLKDWINSGVPILDQHELQDLTGTVGRLTSAEILNAL